MDPNRRHLILGLAAVALSGCGWLRDDDKPRRGRGRRERQRPAPHPEPPGRPDKGPPPGGDFRSPAKGVGPKHDYQAGRANRLEYTFESQKRSAAVFVPSSYDGNKPVPLVVALHGHGGDWQVMAKDNGWMRICEDEGWIGVFPNVGARHNKVDPQEGDHDFIMDVVYTVLRDLKVDRTRIYGVGFSGGCKKTYRLAARESHLFAAIGVAGGKMGETNDAIKDWDPRVTKANKVSVLHFHGEKDAKVPMDGSTTRDNNRPFVPTIQGLEIWATHNGCSEKNDPSPPSRCPNRVWTRRWEGPSGHVVQGLIDPDLKHEWPGAWANQAILAFFASVPNRV